MIGGEAGEKVYSSACVACHGTGAAGAPKVGDKESWSQRADQGLETLVSNAINGKQGMPAKGGKPTLTDEEIRQAVEYMLRRTGVPAS
jgi:cytochrome c5